VAGYRPQILALSQKRMDGGMTLAGAHRDPILSEAFLHQLAHKTRGQLHRGWVCWRFGLPEGTQVNAVLGNGALDCFAEVVPQVPAVGDLDGAGCAPGGAFGMTTGSVPAQDLNIGMGPQPGRE
jgi:hypothetical protein